MSIKQHIPIINVPDTPLIGTSQDRLPLADITENLVLFKDGGAALIMESTSLNFGLLSEREQEAVVAAFAALINSLSFPTQILVRTQKKDVSIYLHAIDEQLPKIKNPKLRDLMIGYKNFISETIKKKNVLGKRFFIIVPFSPYELGIAAKGFTGSISKQKGPLPYTKEFVLKKAQTSLYPKRDHLARQASRLGLKFKQLNNEELIRLFYNVYNPDVASLKIRTEEE